MACPPGRLQKIPQNRPKFTYIKYVKDEIENSKNISIKKKYFSKIIHFYFNYFFKMIFEISKNFEFFLIFTPSLFGPFSFNKLPRCGIARKLPAKMRFFFFFSAPSLVSPGPLRGHFTASRPSAAKRKIFFETIFFIFYSEMSKHL